LLQSKCSESIPSASM